MGRHHEESVVGALGAGAGSDRGAPAMVFAAACGEGERSGTQGPRCSPSGGSTWCTSPCGGWCAQLRRRISALSATAALSAIQNVARSNVPALGYTIAYAVGNMVLIVWGVVIALMMR